MYDLHDQGPTIMEKHINGDDVNKASIRVQRSAPARANQVSKEEVRLLAIQFGVREAARRLGLSEDRVRNWSSRYKWLQRSTPKQLTPVTPNPSGDVLLDELAENERETRLSLSRYAKNAARDAEQATLRDAAYVHKAAQVAGIVHKWSNDDKPTQFTLNMLNINSLQIEDKPE